jgi:antirestriction protein
MNKQQAFDPIATCVKPEGGCGYLGHMSEFRDRKCPKCSRNNISGVSELTIHDVVDPKDVPAAMKMMIDNFRSLTGKDLSHYYNWKKITVSNMTEEQKKELGL